MLKTLINYLRYSGLFVRLTFNPLQWRLKFQVSGPTDTDPKMYAMDVVIAFIGITVIIDDGSW